MLALLLFTNASVARGADLEVAGQPVPARRLVASDAEFAAAENEIVMHYYGVGGWGIQWRGEYLLLAPYFSLHKLPTLLRRKSPDIELISRGIAGTPFTTTGLVLVGHGHVDHAADIPGYFAAGLPVQQSGLIANRTTIKMLDSLIAPNPGFRCAEAPADDGASLERCTLSNFRIHGIASAHAPNVKLFGSAFLVSEGTHSEPLDEPPERPMDYLAGNTWAYLIDLLDDAGNIVFRMHYMDAVAGDGQSQLPSDLIDARGVDVHIACVPGFDYVTDYPEWAIRDGQARFTMLGHWEDFFGGDSDTVKPVRFVLNERKLQQFVARVEDAIEPDTQILSPTNKGTHDCPPDAEMCGPRGDNWALPVPGETFRFRVDLPD